MTYQTLMANYAGTKVRVVVAAVGALAIFLLDVATPTDITFSVLYVVVVLMASTFCEARGVWLVFVGCVGLTLLGQMLSPPGSPIVGFCNTVLAIMAMGLTAFVGVQRRSAEMALREKELLDLTHDPIFSRDMNHVIVAWNRSAEDLYGWSAAEAIGKVSHQLLNTVFPVPLSDIMAELSRTGRWQGELVRRKRDGTLVILASHMGLKNHEPRRAAVILEIDHDITERRRTQEKLWQAQENLARVNRVMLMGELTASIAHDVNQPVAAAAASAEACMLWLAADPPNINEAITSLERVVRGCHHAGEVIGRMHGLLKKQPLRKDRVDINEIIREVIAINNASSQRSRIMVRTHLAPDLPVITADRVQLQQVVLNLIVNAAEAMKVDEAGPRDLTVSSGRGEFDQVFVEVKDSGPGLDPAHLDHLFNSFRTTKANGLGLGLAISRSIVEAHGGRIWAEPNVARGAVFRFTMPIGALSSADKVAAPS
jgi:two-component system sensor kinase FixL